MILKDRMTALALQHIRSDAAIAESERGLRSCPVEERACRRSAILSVAANDARCILPNAKPRDLQREAVLALS
jgi:hypothetical protein